MKSLKADIPIDSRGRPLRQTRAVSQSRGAYNRLSETKVSRIEFDQCPVGSPHMNGRPSLVNESNSYLFRAGTSTGTSDSRASFFARRLRCPFVAPIIIPFTRSTPLLPPAPLLHRYCRLPASIHPPFILNPSTHTLSIVHNVCL